MQTTFSTGLGLQRGAPADGTLRDQFTSELFYRFQLTQFLALTPDVQLIVDPALNPSVDVLGFFGIRLRAAF
jgi:porin